MKRILSSLLLTGAACLAVGAQTAQFRYFTYTGNDARFQKAVDPAREYMNPIIAGFAPDPSICRRGDTYYLVNSSFTFFPGVPIYTSRDLLHWQQLGYVLDRESQLPLAGQHVSGGIYAPDITYNEKNKTFYMITTNVGRGNFFVKTQDPAQGWSEPVYLPKVGGIDPSFFFDKDGRGYIVHNDVPATEPRYEGERSIWIQAFDVRGDSVVGPHREILRSGTHVQPNPVWIEGPHMYRIGKYYYLMCAEGGTGDWHSEVILRASVKSDPTDPAAWEECPHNPILTQRQGLDPNRPDIVTSTGHADLVQTPAGDWFAVFLGCRPYEADFYNTGRDTYMLPVTWADGWPTILDKGQAVPTVVPLSAAPAVSPSPASVLVPYAATESQPSTGNFSYTDRFDGPRLHLRWNFLRQPTDCWQLGPDGLTLRPMAGNILKRDPLSAIFCRQQHTDFTAETELTFAPQSARQLAGFALLQNEEYNFVFGTTLLQGRRAVVLKRTEKQTMLIGSALLSASPDQPLRLKIEGHGRYYDFLFAEGDGAWQVLARGVDAVNLSTHQSGGFIGACIGLYATTDNQ